MKKSKKLWHYVTLSNQDLQVVLDWYKQLPAYIPAERGIDFIQEYQYYVEQNNIKPGNILQLIIRKYWKQTLRMPNTFKVIYLLLKAL